MVGYPGGHPPVWDDDNDGDDTDNDEDVEGLCFSACTHVTNATHKQLWLCNPTMVEGNECFAKHITWHREQENGGRGK